MLSARSVHEIRLFLYRFNVNIPFIKRQFLHANYVERKCFRARIRILIAPLHVLSLAFIMAAIRALLAGENAHSRGQLE